MLIEWERENDTKVRIPESISDTVGWVLTEGNDQQNAYGKVSRISEEKLFHVL